MKVDKEGAAILENCRPSEDTFEIQWLKNKCDHCYYKYSALNV